LQGLTRVRTPQHQLAKGRTSDDVETVPIHKRRIADPGFQLLLPFIRVDGLEQTLGVATPAVALSVFEQLVRQPAKELLDLV
jgi:hypothetical protein